MEFLAAQIAQKLKNANAKEVEDVIRQTLFREGFARKTLLHKTLKKGETPRITVRKKDISFSEATGTGVGTSIVRNNFIYPKEYTLLGHAVAEDMDVEQDPELLEEMVLQILEQTLVKEDTLWKRMVDANAGPAKPFQNIGEMKAALNSLGVPAGMLLVGSGFWPKIQNDPSLDPASKREIVQTGRLSKIWGVGIHTDSYRDPSLKVLDANDVYMVPQPAFLGSILDRKPLTVEETHGAAVGRPETGFFFEAIQAMAVINKPQGAVIRRKI